MKKQYINPAICIEDVEEEVFLLETSYTEAQEYMDAKEREKNYVDFSQDIDW